MPASATRRRPQRSDSRPSTGAPNDTPSVWGSSSRPVHWGSRCAVVLNTAGANVRRLKWAQYCAAPSRATANVAGCASTWAIERAVNRSLGARRGGKSVSTPPAANVPSPASTRKSTCQTSPRAMTAEPTSGPVLAPRALNIWSVPMAAARRAGGKRSLTSAPPTTRPAATPMAWRLRASRNTPMLGAQAPSRLATTYSPKPPASTALPEKRSTRGP